MKSINKYNSSAIWMREEEIKRERPKERIYYTSNES